jgi:hypothetical protein
MVLHIKKRIVVSIRKSTVRFILVLYFILLFSFVAYLGDWGNWKHDKYSETAYTVEELKGEDRTFVLPKD